MQLPLNFVHLGLLTGRVEVGFMGRVWMWLVWMGGNRFYWLAGRGGLGLLHIRVGMGTFSRGFALCSRLLCTRRKLTPSPSLLLLLYSTGSLLAFSILIHARVSVPAMVWLSRGVRVLLALWPWTEISWGDLVLTWSKSILRWACLFRLPVPLLILLCFWSLWCTLLVLQFIYLGSVWFGCVKV
jgi:hypothetical protein